MVICYNDNRKSVPSVNLLVCVTCEWNPLFGFDRNTLEQHEELNSIPVHLFQELSSVINLPPSLTQVLCLVTDTLARTLWWVL